LSAIGIVLIPKKFVATNTPWIAWLAASSARVGIAANAVAYAAAAISCWAAAWAPLALARISHARYGACAAT
jgi:hypothetical protein